MISTTQTSRSQLGDRFLRSINLRSDEFDRTRSMFLFYAATSFGLMWLEACSVDLFLVEFGATQLPLIYLASSALKITLGLLYAWLQRMFPLRWVVVIVALFMAAPLLIFAWGLEHGTGLKIGGFYVIQISVFAMQLWLEASHVLNDLNTSITANQLFNVREIKRTYPLISSGILVADVVGGFSLPLVLTHFSVPIVIVAAFGLMLVGAGVLMYLSQTYQRSFPDFRRRREDNSAETATPRLRGQLRRYVWLLQIFFALAQVFLLLIEFQFLNQLGQHTGGSTPANSGSVASFLGIFNGTLGICELSMQWTFSSRIIDRVGVFIAVMLLPIAIISVTGISMTGLIPVFLGVVGLRFLYELLHYTLFNGSTPYLFYAVPEHLRNRAQASVRGIAEPISTAIAGLALLGLVQLGFNKPNGIEQNFSFGLMILLAIGWLLTIVVLKKQYSNLLVLSAERGLSTSEVDLRALAQKAIDTLEKPGAETHKLSCIELLNQIDPKNAGTVLAPMLLKLSPKLQHKSLEAMLNYPNLAHLEAVKALIDEQPEAEVLALALRYVWLTDAAPELKLLLGYLKPEIPAIVRATAATLILRQGSLEQKVEATKTLRAMLRHSQTQERVIGCRALGEAVSLQELRVCIEALLPDPAIEVQCAVLEVIGATRFKQHYKRLLQGLYHDSTRAAAKNALVRLEEEAIPALVRLADNIHRPMIVRHEALSAIGQIGTPTAINLLIFRLKTSWGNTRRSLLRTLLKLPNDRGIEAVVEQLTKSGIEQLIEQELMFIGQMYAALSDLIPDRIRCEETNLLRAALIYLPTDSIERILLLMKFLYPVATIQIAEYNLQSKSRFAIAQALEILDNTLDISSKRALLGLLDRELIMDKLQSLSDLVPYTPMRPHDRVLHLLELRHFISDWALACCFHLAKRAQWTIPIAAIHAGLRHPTGYVREAILSYLDERHPQALIRYLSRLEGDRNLIVDAQIKALMQRYSATSQIVPENLNRSNVVS